MSRTAFASHEIAAVPACVSPVIHTLSLQYGLGSIQEEHFVANLKEQLSVENGQCAKRRPTDVRALRLTQCSLF